MTRALSVLLMVAMAAGMSGCCCSHGGCLTGLLGGGCGGGGGADCYDTCDQTGCETCAEPGCQTCGEPNAGLGGLLGMDNASCDECGGQGCGLCLGRRRQAYPPGPPVGTITYPYYTTRGPRDFLAQNPRSIGP